MTKIKGIRIYFPTEKEAVPPYFDNLNSATSKTTKSLAWNQILSKQQPKYMKDKTITSPSPKIRRGMG